MNLKEAHSDFLRLLEYENPLDAMSYYRALPKKRRVQLQLYVEANVSERRKINDFVWSLVVLAVALATIYWVVK